MPARFVLWSVAYRDAVRRAQATRLRYRVHYDAANRLWNVTETIERHSR